MVSSILHKHGRKNQLISLGIGRRFVPHATVDEQRQMIGIDARSIAERSIEIASRICVYTNSNITVMEV